MTPEEYRQHLCTIASAAGLIRNVDVPDLLARIERADAFGAVLDPTLYRARHDAMMQDKRLLEAALPLYHLAKELQERALARLNAIARGEEQP